MFMDFVAIFADFKSTNFTLFDTDLGDETATWLGKYFSFYFTDKFF